MDLHPLTIVKSLPDFQQSTKEVVPLFGGKCFDITLDSPEHAARLAASGFDYEHSLKPLSLSGARTIHVSIFVSVEYPGDNLLSFLRSYGTLKRATLRRLLYTEEGFTNIERERIHFLRSRSPPQNHDQRSRGSL